MPLEIVEDVQNPLLQRREVTVRFPSAGGTLTRRAACEALAAQLALDLNLVYPIHLRSRAGTADLIGLFYVYADPARAKLHLPPYRHVRRLPKEERAKLKEQARKAKTPAPAAPKKP